MGPLGAGGERLVAAAGGDNYALARFKKGNARHGKRNGLFDMRAGFQGLLCGQTIATWCH